jgi:hypothetical protein
MPVFVRLTLAVAAALIAFFVLLFVLKVLVIAAIVSALVIGVGFLVSRFRRRSIAPRIRTPIMRR